eukprot:731272-Amphidinium_carterae.1
MRKKLQLDIKCVLRPVGSTGYDRIDETLVCRLILLLFRSLFHPITRSLLLSESLLLFPVMHYDRVYPSTAVLLLVAHAPHFPQYPAKYCTRRFRRLGAFLRACRCHLCLSTYLSRLGPSTRPCSCLLKLCHHLCGLSNRDGLCPCRLYLCNYLTRVGNPSPLALALPVARRYDCMLRRIAVQSDALGEFTVHQEVGSRCCRHPLLDHGTLH